MHVLLAGLAVLFALWVDYLYSSIDSNAHSFGISQTKNKSIPEPNLLDQKPRVLLEPSFSCNLNGPLQLLILVMVRPYGIAMRDAIRQTWGRELHRISPKVRVFFVVGVRTDRLPSFFTAEKRWNDDLVVLSFHESYANLTLKTMLALRWSQDFCPSAEFVMKSDDDVIIFPSVVPFIQTVRSRGTDAGIWGKCFLAAPDREPSSKWFISWELWPDLHYPYYCSGHAFLMTGKVVGRLISQGNNFDYFPVEDVFYTGILAKSLSIPRIDVPQFKTTVSPEDACKNNVFTVHRVKREGEMRKFWLAFKAYCRDQ